MGKNGPMSFQEKHFLSVNSRGFHRLVYNDWGAPQGHLVVAVHGLTCNGHDYDDLARALAQEGYRFIALDLPGRGRSDALPDPADYNIGQYCHDVAALLAHLDLREGAPLDWIGTSLGGLIGMVLASMEGSPITRLLVNDVGPEITAQTLSYLHDFILTPRVFGTLQDLEADMRAVQRAGWGPLTDAQWHHLARHYARALPDGTLSYNYDPHIAHHMAPGRAQDMDLWAHWARIRQPVMILQGGQSLLLRENTIKKMTEALKPGQTSIVAFDDCGHAPSLLAPAHIEIVKQWLNTAPPQA